ncbi:hypothetical protein [uncultured Psychrobacter sp.]|uniref:hypothetical protein n=1 Tax=uncultured Psychrobacter sp. TaxID=259303 RepID=UPI0034590EF5
MFGVEQPEPMFEQPAPLQFPKSDPDAVFASLINTAKEDSSNETNAWADNDGESALQDKSLSTSFKEYLFMDGTNDYQLVYVGHFYDVDTKIKVDPKFIKTINFTWEKLKDSDKGILISKH